PSDRARFNGTVILDWVNVTAQFENAVDTLEAHQLFHRDRYAYVHVSAQAAGVCCTPLTPKVWDPVRYAPLSHPGDDYAFDMFSQIAQLMKTPPQIDPMAGLPVARVIAVGQSQSGTRLRNYLIEVQPQARVIDAFLIHADGSGAKSYPADPQVPTIQLLSEREATPEAPNVAHNYRLWEVAGAAHQDFWIGVHQVQGQGPRATLGLAQQPGAADEALHAQAGNYGEQYDPGQFVCIVEGTQFPLRYAVMAAIHHLDRWVRDGTAPPQGPRYAFDGSGALARDADGNALGGIRLPPIEVPVASYRSDLCNLGGITIPFSDAELQQRYPTHADYYCRMQAATERSLAEGFLLLEDAADLMRRVEQAGARWPEPGERDC
ncbi:MAG: alpha/beta hydrolase domain-containing protein, partial [Gammaproteobacteria bacterium]